nr:putative bifunctional glucose-6-phosphate/mannose-6-phosphate isomerase [uncultured archaeon]
MITSADILKIDQTFVHKAYEKWPEHFKKASRISASADHDSDYYDSLVFCGVGGSGTNCDILQDIVHYDSSVPSVVVKGGRIPQFTNKRTLAIVNSVSGNTKETISMMKACSKAGAETVSLSSGGILKEEAERLGAKHINIPNLSLPRASLPYLLMPSIRLISPLLRNPPKTTQIHKSIKETAKKVSIFTPYENNVAKQVADFMEGGLAFCFTSPFFISAGTRFKNSLNENSKLHCLRESIMEASHNEIVPFTFHNNFQSKVLLLSWIADSPEIVERFRRFKTLFKEIKQPFMQVIANEKSLFDAIVSSIYILDYASIYMAVSRKIDPSPTPAIDIIKSLGR